MKRKRDVAANTPRKKLKRENATVAQQVATLQSQVRILAKTEEVKLQSQAAAGNMNISGAYATTENCVTRITQGIAANQRIGAKINCLGLEIKYYVRSRTSELTEPTQVRVIVFVDKQPITGTTTAPVFQSLLTPDGLLSNATGTLTTCGTNFVSRRRYKILYDKVITINPDTVADYDPVTGNSTAYFPKTAWVRKWIPLNNLMVHYNGVAGTADQIANNNIWMWMGQQVSGSAVGATVDYVSRLYFKDA